MILSASRRITLGVECPSGMPYTDRSRESKRLTAHTPVQIAAWSSRPAPLILPLLENPPRSCAENTKNSRPDSKSEGRKTKPTHCFKNPLLCLLNAPFSAVSDWCGRRPPRQFCRLDSKNLVASSEWQTTNRCLPFRATNSCLAFRARHQVFRV